MCSIGTLVQRQPSPHIEQYIASVLKTILPLVDINQAVLVVEGQDYQFTDQQNKSIATAIVEYLDCGQGIDLSKLLISELSDYRTTPMTTYVLCWRDNNRYIKFGEIIIAKGVRT